MNFTHKPENNLQEPASTEFLVGLSRCDKIIINLQRIQDNKQQAIEIISFKNEHFSTKFFF